MGWAASWAITKLAPSWVPEWLRDAAYVGAWRAYMGRPVLDVLRNELGFSERLAAVFCYMYGNHGRTPDVAPFAFHAVNLFHYRNGAYFPVGGPGQVAECIIPIIEGAGGVMTTWSGGDPQDGGQVVASGDERLHAALLKLLADAV